MNKIKVGSIIWGDEEVDERETSAEHQMWEQGFYALLILLCGVILGAWIASGFAASF